MSKLLYSQRGVPDDEIYEIREVLTKNNIDFYETSSGNWGISMPAFWLQNDGDFGRVQSLLNEYHEQRAKKQREIYLSLKEEGRNKKWLDVFKERPAKILIYIGFIVFILYLYIRMLSEFGLQGLGLS